jgi:hypothetical protein
MLEPHTDQVSREKKVRKVASTVEKIPIALRETAVLSEDELISHTEDITDVVVP